MSEHDDAPNLVLWLASALVVAAPVLLGCCAIGLVLLLLQVLR